MRRGLRIKSLVRREETLRRYPVSGDGWSMTWAADDRQYATLCDGAGFADPPRQLHNSRLLALSGGPEEAKFDDLAGYPTLARPPQKEDDTRYYGYGVLAFDGCLYQFLSTYHRSLQAGELADPARNLDPLHYVGAKLIYSPDNGRTWHNQNGTSPVIWEGWNERSRKSLLFFEEEQCTFSIPNVLQMGKNYELNRDGFVYLYSPNGVVEGTMNELVMARVPKGQILERGAYEFFAGLQPGGSAQWSPDITEREIVHRFPKGWVNTLLHSFAWQPSVVYCEALGAYLMVNWAPGVGEDGIWFAKPSYLGFWMAPNPWGPWEQFHEETAWTPAGDINARAYQPQIAPKWLAPDGKSLWLVWTDYQVVTDGAALKQATEARQRRGSPNDYTEEEVAQFVAAQRKDTPYYAFNAQRVDVVGA